MDLPVVPSFDQATGSPGAAAPVLARRGRGGGGPRFLLAVAANGRRWGVRPLGMGQWRGMVNNWMWVKMEDLGDHRC